MASKTLALWALLLIVHVTTPSALSQPHLYTASLQRAQEETNRTDDFPDFGGLVNSISDVAGKVGGVVGQVSGAVDDALSQAVTTAATSVNKSLESIGDLIRELQANVHDKIVKVEHAVNDTVNEKATVFKNLTQRLLKEASGKLQVLAAALSSTAGIASGALELVGAQEAAHKFKDVIGSVVNTSEEWKAIIDVADESLENVTTTDSEAVAAAISATCSVPLLALFDAADKVKSMAAGFQQAFENLTQDLLAALGEKLPAAIMHKLEPPLSGLTAQAKLQLQPAVDTAVELADGVKKVAALAGIEVHKEEVKHAEGEMKFAIICAGCLVAFMGASLACMHFFDNSAK